MAFDYRTEYQRYRQYYVNLRRFYQKPVARVSFFVLLSFMTVVFFSVFAIRPTVTTIGALIRDIEDKRRINDQLSIKIKALDEVQAVVISMRNDVPLVTDALPESAALGRLTQEMEFVAKSKGVVVTGMRFQPVTLTDPATSDKQLKAKAVDWSISVGGTLENLRAFVDDLERLDRVLVLVKVQWIGASEAYKKQGFPVLVEIEGQAFFL